MRYSQLSAFLEDVGEARFRNAVDQRDVLVVAESETLGAHDAHALHDLVFSVQSASTAHTKHVCASLWVHLWV